MSEYIPDNLIAGDFPIKAKSIIVASGQVLTRGAVLGVVTASGKAVLSESAATDGSQDAKMILAEDVDASAVDVVATAYITGEFAEEALTIGTGHTVDSIRNPLHLRGIIIRKTV